MCIAAPKIKPSPIAAYDNQEALRQGAMEERLRKRRAGAAANILTSPVGIPAGAKLGQAA
jgi:hypothetical protein